MSEHFVLTFTKTGASRISCFKHDPQTGKIMAIPIGRGTTRAKKALASPAGQVHQALRIIRGANERS
jgi:hypothetical protein